MTNKPKKDRACVSIYIQPKTKALLQDLARERSYFTQSRVSVSNLVEDVLLKYSSVYYNSGAGYLLNEEVEEEPERFYND